MIYEIRNLLFTIVAILMTCSVQAQIQKGTNIDGIDAYDNCGHSVSMPDANTMAVGSPGHVFDMGHVRIFSWNGSDWMQKGGDIDGEAQDTRSAYSISMPDSNTIAIGAIYNSDLAVDAGQCRVYRWNGSDWIKKGADLNGAGNLNLFGFAVSMPDSNTLAVGAPLNDDGGNDAGHVKIFTWDGISWMQKGVTMLGESAGDNFGTAVCMSDSNTIAIGARYNDGNGADAGSCHIYSWNGSSWIQKGLDIDGENPGDWSGFSVDMPDTSTVAIGAFSNDDNGTNSGQLRIYDWDGNNWLQKGGDINGEIEDRIGRVSMGDANTLVVGSIVSFGTNYPEGIARAYEWSGTSWNQLGVNLIGEASDDHFGRALSMPNPTTVAVGAEYNQTNGAEAGHVKVFEFQDHSSVEGIKGLKLADFQVYPVPADDKLYLKTTLTEEITHYSIYSIDGKLIEESAFNVNQQSIDISGLQAGVYLFKVSLSNQVKVTEFVKR